MKYTIALLLLTTLAAAHGGGGNISVESVILDSPAAVAGLQAGDRLLTLDGQQVANMDDLEKVMAAHQPGDAVPLTVRRGDETVDLTLTFGERSGGGVSIGVRLAIEMPEGEEGSESTEGTVECLAWIDKTYRIEPSEDYEALRACVTHDTQRMGSANAIKYCDNVFKVHCSGVDLIAEVGEARVQQCAERLGESLGLKLQQYKGWKTCAQHKVFDRYSRAGEPINEEACRAAFLDECGANIDAAVQAGEVSPDQRSFVQCCSTDALDPEQCRMIDDGFSRGPCHDHSVCVDRTTSEWIHCSVLG